MGIVLEDTHSLFLDISAKMYKLKRVLEAKHFCGMTLLSKNTFTF